MDAKATSAMPAALPASVRFLGESRDYWRILSRDAVLLIVTLGLYRFWVANDIRRYLWSNTEIAGDELEYTGDPFELLVGFLVLVVDSRARCSPRCRSRFWPRARWGRGPLQLRGSGLAGADRRAHALSGAALSPEPYALSRRALPADGFRLDFMR